MVRFIDPSWVQQHLSDPSLVIVDPRSVVKYLEGHIPSAVNLPLAKLLDSKTLALMPLEHLSRIFGAAGIDENTTAVFYDSYDGQNAAMLAWVLEYLGHSNVTVLSCRLEGWISEGREVLYKPVTPKTKKFDAKPNNVVRALYIPWTDLIGDGHEFLRPKPELEEVGKRVSLGPTQKKIVTYCSYGPRAAIGYVALQYLGYREVKVYDGSFHQWAQRTQLPVEEEGLQLQF